MKGAVEVVTDRGGSGLANWKPDEAGGGWVGILVAGFNEANPLVDAGSTGCAGAGAPNELKAKPGAGSDGVVALVVGGGAAWLGVVPATAYLPVGFGPNGLLSSMLGLDCPNVENDLGGGGFKTCAGSEPHSGGELKPAEGC